MAYPSVAVRQTVDALLEFVTASGALPRRRSENSAEKALAVAYRDLKARCVGCIRGGTKPSTQMLTPCEVEYFNLIAQALLAPSGLSGLCLVASGSETSSQQAQAARSPTAQHGCSVLAAAIASSSAEQPAHPPSKRLRQKSPAHANTVASVPVLCHNPDEKSTSPAAPGLCPPAAHQSPAPVVPDLCHTAAGSSHDQATTAAIPAAPGLRLLAAGRDGSQPMNLAHQLTLRGLNIQYPFSQLLLMGAKTVEARTFPLGYRKIANPGEDLFLIETPGPRNIKGAMVENLPVGPPPQHAQVVGKISFSSSQAYANESEWKEDRHRHCIKEGGRYDWNGDGDMHAWHVDKVRRFSEPVDAGTKSMTGYSTPRTLEVTLASEHEAS